MTLKVNKKTKVSYTQKFESGRYVSSLCPLSIPRGSIAEPGFISQNLTLSLRPLKISRTLYNSHSLSTFWTHLLKRARP